MSATKQWEAEHCQNCMKPNWFYLGDHEDCSSFVGEELVRQCVSCGYRWITTDDTILLNHEFMCGGHDKNFPDVKAWLESDDVRVSVGNEYPI